MPSRAARARPAASVVALWRDAGGTTHVFMGKRDESLAFLPGYLVFPGGRVERQDQATCDAEWLHPACANVLTDELTRGSAQAFAQAALRECSEETGLDLRPHLDHGLRYIARAITPPRLNIRYDTRFFLALVPESPKPPVAHFDGDGELLGPTWIPACDAEAAPLHHVTRAVLQHALQWTTTKQTRLLVADRRPKHWQGLPALRSRHLKSASQRG